jgi:hypothetical protein
MHQAARLSCRNTPFSSSAALNDKENIASIKIMGSKNKERGGIFILMDQEIGIADTR